MYDSGYSQVSKFSLQAQEKMQHRPKGKSCGYYMRLIFFFSSLIQSLIIVSLVLFLVYGKKQDSESSGRIQDLEQSFNRLSIENVALRLQRKNLTTLLNITMTEKARNDWDLAEMRSSANISYYYLTELNNKLNQCNMERMRDFVTDGNPCKLSSIQYSPQYCGLQAEQMKAMITLVQTNFTQTTQTMRMEMEQIYKERDNINLEAIRLRRDKSVLEKEMAAYRIKCKDDFAHSLSGISNVSKAFLEKIDSLFPRHIPFQLTCQKQRENLEQIRSNCTSLSREVENRFQRYLDNVGAQVSQIQTESSHLKAENWRLVEDYSWCSQNRTGLIREHKQNLQKVQLKYDKEKEQLLMEKRKLSGEKELLGSNLNLKSKEILHLKEQFKQLNFSCSLKTGILTQPGSSWNRLNSGGSSSSSSSAGSQSGRTGSTGSSSLNKPAVNSIGSSSYGSTGSSSSSGSTGIASSKPGSNGVSSSSSGSSRFGQGSSSFGSTGSVSTGVGAAKKPSTGVSLGAGQSTGGFGSSSNSNTGGGIASAGKTSAGSSWGNWFGNSNTGTGNSNTGLNKLGNGAGKGTTSLGGAGSSVGAGRTGGQGGGANSGTVSISQHLQQLQRIANPTASAPKKDAPRLFG